MRTAMTTSRARDAFVLKAILEVLLKSEDEALEWDEEPETDDIYVCVNEDMRLEQGSGHFVG